MVRGFSSGARVFEYLALEPTIPLTGGGRIPYNSLVGRVDFMDIIFRQEATIMIHMIHKPPYTLYETYTAGGAIFLSFSLQSYPTRPGHQILKNFNLTLPPSKTIAIVGESGGGMSPTISC